MNEVSSPEVHTIYLYNTIQTYFSWLLYLCIAAVMYIRYPSCEQQCVPTGVSRAWPHVPFCSEARLPVTRKLSRSVPLGHEGQQCSAQFRRSFLLLLNTPSGLFLSPRTSQLSLLWPIKRSFSSHWHNYPLISLHPHLITFSQAHCVVLHSTLGRRPGS